MIQFQFNVTFQRQIFHFIYLLVILDIKIWHMINFLKLPYVAKATD